MAKSQFIQIVIAQTRGNSETLYALAQDGTVWKHDYEDSSGHFWSQISDDDRRK